MRKAEGDTCEAGAHEMSDLQTIKLTDSLSIPCAFFDSKPVFPFSSQEIGKITTALVSAQAKFERAKKDRDNTFFKSSYADLASVMDACVSALVANGLAIVQPTVSVAGEVYLLTRLMHASGEWLQASFPLSTLDAVKSALLTSQPETTSGGLSATSDEKKKKQPGVQALGSEITYLRRYCLAALLGIAAEEDDDGDAAQQHQNSRPTPPRSNGLGSGGLR